VTKFGKFELSINVKYLPEWGVWEGIRELVQNGQDAEVEYNAPLCVDWRSGTLRIENEGATLNREALLFGTTSKAERTDLIGKFGEGLKLGVLALVRAGRTVKIRSGDEVWTPTIARSERYDADVLVFDVKGGNEDKRRVRVEIGGVIESEWKEFRSRFLFLKDGRESEKHVVKTYDGDLLTHEKYRGKLYVKGIFVTHQPDLQFGYNFRDAELDRDRKMIESYDRKSKIARILNGAVSTQPDLHDDYFGIIEDLDSEEAHGINDWRLPDASVIEAAITRFQTRYGANAVPVRTTAESADVEHFGVKGIVVTEAMAALLKEKLGNAEITKRRFARAIIKQYSVSELTDKECTNLSSAIALLCTANTLSDLRERVDVVDYHNAELQGLHGERISIARKVLSSPDETLRVLVHEAAHDAGSDGDKSHVATIEKYWMAITRHLRNLGAA